MTEMNDNHKLFKNLVITLICVFLLWNFSSLISLFYSKQTTLHTSQMHERNNNDIRILESMAYLKQLTTIKIEELFGKMSSKIHTVGNVDIAITVVSTARNILVENDNYQPKYLTQVVSKLLSLMSSKSSISPKEFKYSVNISVCNVDTIPEEHDEAVFISKYVHVFNKYKTKNGVEFLRTNNTKYSDRLLDKAKEDYQFCLGYISKTLKPRFVVILEDDALPKDNFIDVVYHSVQYFLDASFSDGELIPITNEKHHPVASVKYFHPFKDTKFIRSPERWFDLAGAAIILSSISTFVYIRISTNVSRQMKKIKTLWVIFVSFYIALIWIIGREDFDQWRHWLSPFLYRFSYSRRSYTQCMLYTNSFVKDVVSYLESIHCNKSYGYDTAIEDFTINLGLKRYMVQPNLVEHIGMYSTLKKEIIADPNLL